MATQSAPLEHLEGVVRAFYFQRRGRDLGASLKKHVSGHGFRCSIYLLVAYAVYESIWLVDFADQEFPLLTNISEAITVFGQMRRWSELPTAQRRG